MADVSCVYTLTTPDSTVLFNDGSQSASGQDKLYIQEIQGLGGAPVRAPIDDMPYGHGGLDHNFWEGPRHIVVEGVFLILSAWSQNGMLSIRNQFEEDLRTALRSIAALRTDTGTLVWTPYGQSQRQLTVRHDSMLEFGHDQNYLVETFSFGLVATDPDWDGWSS